MRSLYSVRALGSVLVAFAALLAASGCRTAVPSLARSDVPGLILQRQLIEERQASGPD
jgi:hypothetical protein